MHQKTYSYGLTIGFAIGVLVSLFAHLVFSPGSVAPNPEQLALHEARLESLFKDGTEGLERREAFIDGTLQRLEQLLTSATTQRITDSSPALGQSPLDSSTELDGDAALDVHLPQAIVAVLGSHGVSPTASLEVREAVEEAAQAYRAASRQAMESRRKNPKRDPEERRAYNERVTAIKVEQQNAALEMLGYFLKEYLGRE